jgi:hypothetical protein
MLAWIPVSLGDVSWKSASPCGARLGSSSTTPSRAGSRSPGRERRPHTYILGGSQLPRQLGGSRGGHGSQHVQERLQQDRRGLLRAVQGRVQKGRHHVRAELPQRLARTTGFSAPSPKPTREARAESCRQDVGAAATTGVSSRRSATRNAKRTTIRRDAASAARAALWACTTSAFPASSTPTTRAWASG